MYTVLVVDDSQASREIYSGILQSHSIKVIEAANGIDAQQKLKSSTPDLIITDVVMPEMNGYEFCRWVKNNPSTQKIPVLVCSSKNEEFDRYWGMKQGADAYMTKPFAPPDLLKTIKDLFANSKANA
ncbi:MAG: PleD family two-component system response regulator [Prochloraceae cyanobacterium]